MIFKGESPATMFGIPESTNPSISFLDTNNIKNDLWFGVSEVPLFRERP